MSGRHNPARVANPKPHDPIGAFEAAAEEAIEISETANNFASALQLQGPGGWGGKARETQRT
jgi:hypothetical protein